MIAEKTEHPHASFDILFLKKVDFFSISLCHYAPCPHLSPNWQGLAMPR